VDFSISWLRERIFFFLFLYSPFFLPNFLAECFAPSGSLLPLTSLLCFFHSRPPSDVLVLFFLPQFTLRPGNGRSSPLSFSFQSFPFPPFSVKMVSRGLLVLAIGNLTCSSTFFSFPLCCTPPPPYDIRRFPTYFCCF